MHAHTMYEKGWIEMISSQHTLWLTKSKALSKATDSVKTSGYRKLRRAYSSCRLFCSGVPVSSKIF
jgi:hypothetical protein